MIEKTGLFISGMTIDVHKLVDDVIKRVGLVKHPRKHRIERFTHEQTVKPHLIRIDLLVPESAFPGARMMTQLESERLSCGAETLLTRRLVQCQERSSGCNLVYVVLLPFVSGDVARRSDVLLQILAHELNISPVAAMDRRLAEGFKHETLLVIPFHRG
jgi:hypothetical protein